MSLADQYTSVLHVPVLVCTGIDQDLAYSELFTLFVCSGNIAMTIKKSMCWNLITLTPDQKKTLSAIFVRQILYTIKNQQPTSASSSQTAV